MAERKTKRKGRGGRGVKVTSVAPVPRREAFRRSNRTLRALDPLWTVPVDPAARAVVVRSVRAVTEQPGVLVWVFSSAVSSVDGDPGPLEASVDGVTFVAPTFAGAEPDGSVVAVYDGMDFRAGNYFRITTPPTDLTFAAGRCEVPQVGLVSPALPTTGAAKATAGKITPPAPPASHASRRRVA